MHALRRTGAIEWVVITYLVVIAASLLTFGRHRSRLLNER